MYPNQNCQNCPPNPPEELPPPPPACEGEPCEVVYSGVCVRYTGPDISCLGVTTNMSLNQVIQAIATSLCPVPVNCVVSAWSEWGPCTNGSRTRTRTVITQAANGGTPCPALTETESCNDCVVSAWSEWSACVDGQRTRTRTIVTQPTNGGTACPPLTETESCTDCVVSAWSAWSDCIDGTRTRTRTIITNPTNGGAPCPPLTETENCEPPVCLAPTNLVTTITNV